MNSITISWGSELDGEFRIKGFYRGLPIIEWIKKDIPNEFDFFKQWCNKDPEGAKSYYAR